MDRQMSSPLLDEGAIGGTPVPNRMVRAGTGETMSPPDGSVTEPLVGLYEDLARGGVGLIITGHLYVDERGKYAPGQTGICDDGLLAGLQRLTAGVHRYGGVIFAQLAHAGSQSRVPGNRPVAPSPVPNPLTGQPVAAAGEADVEEAVAAFGRAARRAVEAGFDGVHIHGANGYLISEFASPLTNARDDRWSAGWGGLFPREVASAVRSSVPAGFPVVMKIGVVDAPPGGLGADGTVDPGVAGLVEAAALDAVEVSCNLMQAPTDSARQYVAVDTRRAVQDWLVHRVGAAPEPEGYFRPWARRLRDLVDVPVIVAGGMRTVETMEDVVASGDADFVAMARPFIREPDLAAQIAAGRRGLVDCTSCNLCLMHEGHHPLQCWRVPRRRLFEHAWYRLRGGFRNKPDIIPVAHTPSPPNRD